MPYKIFACLLVVLALTLPTGKAHAADGINSNAGVNLPMGAGGRSFISLGHDGLIRFLNPSNGGQTAWINTNDGNASFGNQFFLEGNAQLYNWPSPTTIYTTLGNAGQQQLVIGSDGWVHINPWNNLNAGLSVRGNVSATGSLGGGNLNLGGHVIGPGELSNIINLANAFNNCGEGQTVVKRGGSYQCETPSGNVGRITNVSGWSVSCETGFEPRTFHANVGNTNNSIVHQCVRP